MATKEELLTLLGNAQGLPRGDIRLRMGGKIYVCDPCELKRLEGAGESKTSFPVKRDFANKPLSHLPGTQYSNIPVVSEAN